MSQLETPLASKLILFLSVLGIECWTCVSKLTDGGVNEACMDPFNETLAEQNPELIERMDCDFWAQKFHLERVNMSEKATTCYKTYTYHRRMYRGINESGASMTISNN